MRNAWSLAASIAGGAAAAAETEVDLLIADTELRAEKLPATAETTEVLLKKQPGL
jgi:hypothetical protein